MLKKISFTFLIKFLIALLNLTSVIIISQYLGAKGKGEVSLIIACVAIIVMLCNIVGGDILVFLIPRYHLFQLILLSNLWTIVVCAVAYFLLIYVQLIPNYFVNHVVVISFLSSILATNLSILLAKEKILSNNLISFVQTLLGLSVLFIVFYFFENRNVTVYVYSTYCALLVALIISTALILPYIKNYSLTGIKNVFKQASSAGIINQTGHITQLISFRLSYFVLNKLAGGVAVGIYSNASSIIESVWLVTYSIAMVQYAKISNSSENNYNQLLTIRLVKINFIISIGIIGVLLALPNSFFTWLFGIEFSEVRAVLFFLAPGILVYGMSLIVGHYFSGIGKYYINTLGNIIGMIITLILTFLIAPYGYGLMEAGIIASVSYITTTMFIFICFKKTSKISWNVFLIGTNDISSMIKKIKSALFEKRTDLEN